MALALATTAGSCWPSAEPSGSSGVGVRRSALVAPPVAVKTSWLQYGGDSTHAGSNPFESAIGVNNVSQLGQLFTVTLNPMNNSGGHDTMAKFPSTPVIDGVNNTAYLVTGGQLVALDSNTGACKWAMGPGGLSVPNCPSFFNNGFTATGNSPSGTGRALNATPAIDPSLGFVYVAAEDTHTTSNGVAGYVHKITSAGQEVTGGGWPQLYNKKIWGFSGTNGEPATPSLSIGYAGTAGPYYLYVGSGDCDSQGSQTDCEGKVTVINLGAGSQKVWNALCSNLTTHFGSAAATPSQDACTVHGAGTWAKAGITFDPITQRMFFGTAEGASFSPSTHIWGHSFVALNADGSGLSNGYPADSYTTRGFADPAGGTAGTGLSHMGHGHMLVLPNNGSNYPHLGVVLGKEGRDNNGSLSLLNLDSMGGGPGVGNTGKELAFVNVDALVTSVTGTATSNTLSTEPAATWINPADGSAWVYYTLRTMSSYNNLGIWAFRIAGGTNGVPTIQFKWRDPTPSKGSNWEGGAFVANGVAYYSDGTNLKAFDAVTGRALSTIASGARRTPVVVNGILYAVAGTTLTAYAPPASAPTNVAAGKWAATSSFLTGVGITDNVTNGKRATDGNLSGAWASNSVFHTLNEGETEVAGMPGGPYWYVDLGATYNVNQIVIYNRTDADCGGGLPCVARLNHFWVHYWTGAQWLLGSDQSGTAIGSPADRANTVNGTPQNNVISVPVRFYTRYVMIQKSNLDYLHLGEVQVYGTTDSATAGSTSSSPVAFESYSPTSPFLGSWDHAMVDLAPLGAHKILEVENHYLGPGFDGWSPTDQTSAVNTNLRGSIFLKGGTGSQLDLVATDPSGLIWETMPGGGGRHNVTLNSPVLAAGSPSGYQRHDGYNTVVFRGTDSRIYESYWDGATTWYTNQLPGQTVNATGDPIGYVRSSSSSEVVYKCNGNQQLCQLRLVNGTWYFRIALTTAAILKGTTMPSPTSAGPTIFYTGVDGIHAIADTSEPWFGTPTDTFLVADSTIVSSPSAYPFGDQNSRAAAVYITDGAANNPSAVMEVQQQTSGWTLSTRATAFKNAETLVGDPAAYVAVAPWLNTILYRNSGGTLYQLQWSTSAGTYVKSTVTIY